MKRILLTLTAIASLTIANAHALDDADGFKIIQNGDVVLVKPTLGLRLYTNKEDLLADEKVCGVYDFNSPQFQAMLKRFDDLQADDKAFEIHRKETAIVVQHEIYGRAKHIAQVKMDGMLLWLDQTGIESDEEASEN
jgi:hypothetical protein